MGYYRVNNEDVSEEVYRAHCDQMKELNGLLRSHDWYYAFSDDGRVYRHGTAEEHAIKEKVKTLGRDGQRLYQAHVDIHFGPHSGFTYSYSDDEVDRLKAEILELRSVIKRG